MADAKLPDYDTFDLFLHQQDLTCSAAEIHGVICGCLCAGMPYQHAKWRKFISEFVLQDAEVDDRVAEKFREIYQLTYQQLMQTDFSFQIYLPDADDIPLSEKAQILLEWLGAFISAFGAVVGEQFATVDKEVRESYQDLISISQMDTDMDESEENMLAFEEVAEYIRMTTLMCFGELGDHNSTNTGSSDNPILH